METKTILELFRKIIAEETRFLRHYSAQVVDVNDPVKKGRVKATVPWIGWDTDEKAPWFYPRQKEGLTTPKVGQWIEVYFMNGNKNEGRYLGLALEMEDTRPSLYDGLPTTHVPFEDPDSKVGIKYDAILIHFDKRDPIVSRCTSQDFGQVFYI